MKGSRLLTLACAVALAAALSACSESHTGDEDAAIVLPDSGPIDAGTDAPEPPSGVGTACSADTDCTGGADLCIEDPDFVPGGYCTASCVGGAPCPDGSTCLQLSRTQAFCFQDCDPAAEMRECRPGYGCSSPGIGLPGSVCLGGCTDDSDCASGLECDPRAGIAGACFDPGAAVGDACGADDDCPMGSACLTEAGNGWPGGACAGLGCDPVSNTGCTGDAQCLPSGFGGDGLCVDGCGTTADCRDGYECRGSATYPDRLVCQPGCTSDAACTGGRVCNEALGTCSVAFDPGSLGGACSRFSGGCDGGTCLDERTYGDPGGYCAYVGCTVGDDSTCPTGGVCAPTASGDGICLRGCATSTDCRAAYRCDHVDPADDTSSSGCVPGCTGAAGECTSMMRTCNPGTGLCTTPFVAGNLGEPCTGAVDCPGGICLADSDGWPAGTCAYPGCAIAGDSSDCPAGGVCVDDATGDPDRGYCIDACTVGVTPCRPGYECVALAGGAEGACRPMASTP